ncbi:high nitrogen upregulated cytochrome P450 monooxygenase 2 [Polyporus arcularius HHB13444]|uniref:High nitrogen upregulated cytochrome P450 monooxygenase 2 n=1 Tax=Polyporus arcularius HHB13444 TaxID=1314778 RepID=A0A5C3P440_9APHY|nr:high nitrogen upregulated cytochrome P450 monooxygenase 2 [Polyporus arcularius HHB13444]
MSLREVSLLTIPFAILAHQVLRRYETYRIYVHACLLLGPPILAAARLTSFRPTPALPPILFNSLVSYLAALVTSVIAYRLSPFHPLAQYPGPLWRRISMFGPAAMATTGNRHRAFASLHQKYGDVVRTGPNELSIADASFVGPLLGASGLPKGPNHVGASMSDTKMSMVGIQDIPHHLQRRRPWNRGLSQQALKGYEPLMAERAQLLVQRLTQQSGPVDLGLWLKYFAYDFMSDVAFGDGSDLLREGDKANIWSIIEDGMVVCTIAHSLPWLGIYLSMIPSAAGPMLAFQENGRRLARERLERGSKTRDLYHYLCNEDLSDNPPPTLDELADDGTLAIVAGSDTVSVALTSVFYCLLTDTEAHRNVQQEIDRLYPVGEPFSETKHHREMHYLQAVINEAMRLFPPIPLGSQRQVPHDAASVVVGSVVIPPGTAIYLPPWVLQRDPRNFTFPDAFWPERWLIASGQLHYGDARLPSSAKRGHERPDFVHHEATFIPFSAGPMNCPGKGLAMMEMRSVVIALMKNFGMKLRDGWNPATFDQEFKDYFTAARPELPVVLEPRLHVETKAYE